MFYSNEDYTVTREMIDDVMRYFITYHTKGCKAPRVEITQDIFKLYCNEFRRPYRKQMEKEAEYGAYLNVEDYLAAPKLDGGFLQLVMDAEEISLNKVQLYEIEKLLATCTETQQRRFRLCVFGDMSFCAAAKLERCDERAIRQSIQTVREKIKKFSEPTSEFDPKSGFKK